MLHFILNLYEPKYLLASMRFPQETGKNELMNVPSPMITVLFDKKTFECDLITT